MTQGKQIVGKTYTIVIDDKQRQILEDAVLHLVEVDLEHMEYTDEQKEEATALKDMIVALPTGDNDTVRDFTA